ncbi:hypothetical protein JCM10212_006633 [Sporobolomyces blumeae]
MTSPRSPPRPGSNLEQLLSTHRSTLVQLYTSLSRSTDPLALVEARFAELEHQLAARIRTQLEQVEAIVDGERKRVEEGWTKVNAWLVALGEETRPCPVRSEPSSTSHGAKSKPLDELVREVDDVIEGLRGRMKERGDRVVELHVELRRMAQVVGDDWIEVPLESVEKGWEELDLKKERLDELERELGRCEAEIAHRRDLVNIAAAEILTLYTELGPPPEGEPAPDDDVLDLVWGHLGVGGDKLERREIVPTAENVLRVQAKRQALEEEQQGRHTTIQETYDRLYPLWTMLGVPEDEMDAFVNRFTGSTLDVVQAYQAELDRMLALRRSNLASFINAERDLLTQLYDTLYLSHSERVARFPALTISVDPLRVWNDETNDEEEVVNENVSEELLIRHERERERAEVEVQDAKPVLERLERYFEIVEKAKALEAAAADPSRLTSRGSSAKLLLEERDRKRVAKEKPKLEADLRALIPEWEAKHRRAFLVNGVSFLEELDEQQHAEELEKENKRRAKMGGSAASARPLRPQPTGTAAAPSVAPLKRQMTGASVRSTSSTSSSVHQPPAKRQVPMATGSSTSSSHYSTHGVPRPKSVLGDASSRIGNVGKTPSTSTKPGTRSRSNTLVTPSPAPTLLPQTTGMRIPAGWGGAVAKSSYVTPQPTGRFRPRPSTLPH